MKNMDEQILFYAFRYVLGRRTYAVVDVAREIIRRAPTLSDDFKNKVKEEIHEAKIQNRIGMEMDEAEWDKVFNAL
jgi:hypothetical protein